MGLPKTSQGDENFLTVVDRLTKRAHFIPTKTDLTTEEFKYLFMRYIVVPHGLPDIVTSDRDKVLREDYKQTLQDMGVKVSLTVAHRAQANGQAERVNQTIMNLLKTTAVLGEEEWPMYLLQAEIQYNNTVTSHGYSPYYADLGYHPRFPLDSPLDVYGEQSPHEFQSEFVTRMAHILKNVRDRLTGKLPLSAANYDAKHTPPPKFSIGDWVWLTVPPPRAAKGHKLDVVRCGPYLVLENEFHPNYTLQIPDYLGPKTFNVDTLKEFVPRPGEPRPLFRMPPRRSAEDDTAVPVRILNHYSKAKKSRKKRYWFEVEYSDGDTCTHVSPSDLKDEECFKAYCQLPQNSELADLLTE